MSNSNWSQFSYRPKIFMFDPLLLFGTGIGLFISQWAFFLVYIIAAIWIFVLFCQFILKMPTSYVPFLIRRKITGNSKKPKNWRDNLEL